MNQKAIEDFRIKANGLRDVLGDFLKWANEVESQDKLYEQKMQQIADKNKELEAKNTENMHKEDELNKRELLVAKNENKNRIKSEELLIREQGVQKEKEALIHNKTQFEKEKASFERAKLNEDILINMKRQLEDRKIELDEKESLLLEKEKVVDTRSSKLADRERLIKQRETYLQGLLTK